VTQYSVVVGYQHFRRKSCFHPQGHNTTWRHNPEDCDLNLHCCDNLKSCIMNFLKGSSLSLLYWFLFSTVEKNMFLTLGSYIHCQRMLLLSDTYKYQQLSS
jgi:hypothetical protein